MLTGMRSWPLLVVLATACWSACWSDRPARTTTPTSIPTPTGTGAPAAGVPPTSGIRFVTRAANRCARVIDHLFEQSKSEFASSGLSDAFLEEMQELAVATCQETAWSPESLDCYERTESSAEISTCFTAMTPEQQDDFKKRMTELLQRQQNVRSPSPPPP